MDSGFSNFFGQIPTGLIILFCGSGILLVGSLFVMVGARNRKAQAALAALQAQYAANAASRPSMMTMNSVTSNDSDMPDVEFLLNTDTLTVEIPAARVPRPGTYSVRTVDGETLEAVEVLAVLRDVAEGGLLIQIGDQIVRNPPAIADSEFKRRFNSTVSELAKTLTLPKAPPAAPMRPTSVMDQENAPAEPLTEPTLDELTDLPAAPPTEMSRSTSTTARVIGTAPGDLPKFTLNETPISAKPLRRVPKPTNDPIPEINVGGSIEAYLQHRLAITPEFAGRSIHIRSSPKGSVIIEVDGRQYEAVGDVEDTDAKLFLAETIEEWQSRQ